MDWSTWVFAQKIRPSRQLTIVLVCLLALTIAIPRSSAWPKIASPLRNQFLNGLSRAIPSPHAEFLGGVLLGGSEQLPSSLQKAFRRTGTSHILAASGYNVAVFSTMLSLWLMRRLGRRRGLALSFLAVAAYVVLAGASVPVVRAGLMASCVLLGSAMGRRADTLNLLLLAAVIVLVIDPSQWTTPGFQLSFAATAALIGWTPSFERTLSFIPKVADLRSLVASSLAASLVSIPIVLWHFGTLSLVSVLVNILILPFIPLAMAAGAVSLVGAFFFPSIAPVIGVPAWAVTSLILWIVRTMSELPFAQWQV